VSVAMSVAVSVAVSVIVTIIVFVLMLGELLLSRANERALRSRGAIEPADDVYQTMAWMYPVSFLAMGLEGALIGPSSRLMVVLGVFVFVAAKAIKYWAVASLGPRWSFRVLVLPGAPLVTRGPYAWLRHPNYVGVVGELVGVALLVAAPVTGTIATMVFVYLLRRRIVTEDRALGRDHTVAKGV
jgi:methyltransferase